MYLFSDPSNPLGRYIDSWTSESGVTSYGGYVNEHFQDKAINCTIKWAPGQPTAGIYAKQTYASMRSSSRAMMGNPNRSTR